VTNPLDLPGPQFLLFYASVGAVVLYAIWMMQNGSEGGDAPRVDMSDPYVIAYLRGGAREAARVATISLVDRGVLVANDATLTPATLKTGTLVALEQAIVATLAHGGTMTDVFQAPRVDAACAAYVSMLARHGLIPDEAMRTARRRRLRIALAILLGLAVLKIVVALSRGRTNIIFLIILAVAFTVIAAKLTFRLRTARGTAFLNDLRVLFARLRDRSGQLMPGTATTDVALLAAVFGVAALPAERFTYVRRLFPRANEHSSCGTVSSCGGGGGDGGGCGGCGGGGGD